MEQAFPPDWIDDVFETHRRWHYGRELLFSTVVELMTLVVLGLRPSPHAAARRSENLPVSLTALYDKVIRPSAPLYVLTAMFLGIVAIGLATASPLTPWLIANANRH